MSQKMRFAKVGDIIKINRRKLRITKVDTISDGVRPDCWGYTMEYVTGKGFSWTGLGYQLEVPDTSKCGNCDHWCRGGIGHGRGGGSCLKYNLSKVASNTCGGGPHGCHSSYDRQEIGSGK